MNNTFYIFCVLKIIELFLWKDNSSWVNKHIVVNWHSFRGQEGTVPHGVVLNILSRVSGVVLDTPDIQRNAVHL